MHAYRIIYRSFNRRTGQMHRHLAQSAGRSPWGALRHWWRYERQWHNPCVTVEQVELDHRQCPQIQYPTHWVYTCGRV